MPAQFQSAPGQRPNIIFIVADDLGFADLGCYGGQPAHFGAVSPVLDQLPARGIKFTQGYSNSPVCSPTRFALMTARYQYRLRGVAEEPISGLCAAHGTGCQDGYTMLDAAGTKPNAEHPLDGVSMLPVLRDSSHRFARLLHWRMNHRGQRALRYGDWKYLRVDGNDYLFNITDDERERANHGNPSCNFSNSAGVPPPASSDSLPMRSRTSGSFNVSLF